MFGLNKRHPYRCLVRKQTNKNRLETYEILSVSDDFHCLTSSSYGRRSCHVEIHIVLYLFPVQVQLLCTCWAAGTFNCLRSKPLRMIFAPGSLARLFREVSFVSHHCSSIGGTQYRLKPSVFTRSLKSILSKVVLLTWKKAKARLYNGHLAWGVVTSLEKVPGSFWHYKCAEFNAFWEEKETKTTRNSKLDQNKSKLWIINSTVIIDASLNMLLFLSSKFDSDIFPARCPSLTFHHRLLI